MSLKKEFSKEQIQRMRNLITGKYGDKVTNQIETKTYKDKHLEGDIWEEDGSVWTIKDGIRETVNPYDEIYKSLMIPLTCPKCNTIMNKRLDKVYYPIYENCFNCEVDKRDELEKEGKLEEYLKPKKDDFLDKSFEEFESFIRNKVATEINDAAENGDEQNYEGGYDLDAVEEYIQKARLFKEKQKE